MKRHYDFSSAKQGELYRPASTLRMPIYLDPDVQRKLAGKGGKKNVSKLVNSILRSQLGVTEMLK